MEIEARNISLIYDIEKQNDAYALKDIHLKVGAREILGVMGPSGSGKSSLLYVLSGLRKPTSGSVCHDGQDIEWMTPEDMAGFRRRKFGFIFQRHFLVEYLSVLDNVMLPCFRIDESVRARALDLLGRLGITHAANKKPAELSHGQKQRVAVARALVNKPEVIFADEPTASLDHKNAMDVMAVLQEETETAAVVVVTHDGSVLGNANRVVELWDGRIKKVEATR